MARRRIDPTRRLARAILTSARAAGCELVPVAERSKPWNTATFDGLRLEYTFNAVAGDALDRWLEQLPSVDFRTPGHLVADIATASVAWSTNVATVLINALTVEER